MEFSITSEGTLPPPLKLWNTFFLFILYMGSKKCFNAKNFFQLRLGAQERLMFVRSYLRSVQVCLELSIFIILAQTFKLTSKVSLRSLFQVLRSLLGLSQVSLSSVLALSQLCLSSLLALSQLSLSSLLALSQLSLSSLLAFSQLSLISLLALFQQLSLSSSLLVALSQSLSLSSSLLALLVALLVSLSKLSLSSLLALSKQLSQQLSLSSF